MPQLVAAGLFTSQRPMSLTFGTKAAQLPPILTPRAGISPLGAARQARAYTPDEEISAIEPKKPTSWRVRVLPLLGKE
ncbi:MAG: hypothetical protein SXV54_11050 [Chloroflexota bacterium]|nr:hypothetical protein [Chloroflexota bacterium]